MASSQHIPRLHELVITTSSSTFAWRKQLRPLAAAEASQKSPSQVANEDQIGALIRAGHPTQPDIVRFSPSGLLIISATHAPFHVLLSNAVDVTLSASIPSPGGSTVKLREAVFHPERKEIFALLWDDDSVAAYDGSQILAGRTGEISNFKGLAGVTAGAFIPGSMSKLLTVSNRGRATIIQFEAAEKRRAQVVGSWDIAGSCTSVAILNIRAIESARAAAAKRDGKGAAPYIAKKMAAGAKKSPWIAAIGRENGKVGLHDSSLELLEVAQTGDQPVTSLSWFCKDSTKKQDQSLRSEPAKPPLPQMHPVSRRKSVQTGKRRSLGQMLAANRTGEQKVVAELEAADSKPAQMQVPHNRSVVTPQIQKPQIPVISSVEAKILTLQAQLEELKRVHVKRSPLPSERRKSRRQSKANTARGADGWEDVSEEPAHPMNTSSILSSIRSVNAMGNASAKKGFALFAQYAKPTDPSLSANPTAIKEAQVAPRPVAAEQDRLAIDIPPRVASSQSSIKSRKSIIKSDTSQDEDRETKIKARKSVIFEPAGEDDERDHVLHPKSPHPKASFQVLTEKPMKSRLVSPTRHRPALGEIGNATSPNKKLASQVTKEPPQPKAIPKKASVDFRSSVHGDVILGRRPQQQLASQPGGSAAANAQVEAILASLRMEQMAFQKEMEGEMRNQRKVFEASLKRKDDEEQKLRAENQMLKSQLAQLVEEVEQARMLGLACGTPLPARTRNY